MKKIRQHNNVSEIRTVPDEIRMAPDGHSISGYAAVWDAPSADLGFVETIQKGAFTDSLAAGDQRLLREHRVDALLARVASGTLKLAEDSYGLKFNATLPQSPMGQDVAESIRRGDLRSMSFGFRCLPNGDTWATAASKSPGLFRRQHCQRFPSFRSQLILLPA